jgi:hypothetical protein
MLHVEQRARSVSRSITGSAAVPCFEMLMGWDMNLKEVGGGMAIVANPWMNWGCDSRKVHGAGGIAEHSCTNGHERPSNAIALTEYVCRSCAAAVYTCMPGNAEECGAM